MTFDAELWERTVLEALRPIDPAATFNVSLSELDLRGTRGHDPNEFPADELAAAVDEWLVRLDPDGAPSTMDWQGGGVRLVIQARGRGPSWRGWDGMPSLNLLEPVMDDLHLIPGGRCRFVDLNADQVAKLAAGELQVVGQGASYRDSFEMLLGEMGSFGHRCVAEMNPLVIATYAGLLGLVPSPPGLGNFDATWRGINRRPPTG